MHDIDLYIVAAGNGSRLHAGIPKALVPILDEPCLTTTLKLVVHGFRKVFVVTNTLVRDAWNVYFKQLELQWPELAPRVVNLPIRSGFGDGHATLHGMLAAELDERVPATDDVVIMWGDVFLPSSHLIRELLSQPRKGAGSVPAVMEGDPYVCLRVNAEMQCLAADFSKYGEGHPNGLHDQCVFRFRRRKLLETLLELHRCLWKNDHYITPGGELSLLYSFHKMYNSGDPVYVYETSEATRSFNTEEEVREIRREMRGLCENPLR